MVSQGPEQTGGDQGSGMSDSGSPCENGDASGPSGNVRRRGGGAVAAEGGRHDERILRRREINRNSQKRIRERRNIEVNNLRTETQRLSSENEALLQQVESLTLARADMLRQVQDLTDKWQQSIAENAWLNRENIQLRSAVQQLNTLLASGTGSAVPGNATPGSAASTLTAACRTDGGAAIPLLSQPVAASSSPLPVLSLTAATRGVDTVPACGHPPTALLGRVPSCLSVPVSALSSLGGPITLASADSSFNSTRQALTGSDGSAGAHPPGMQGLTAGLPRLSSLGALLAGPQPLMVQATD